MTTSSKTPPALVVNLFMPRGGVAASVTDDLRRNLAGTIGRPGAPRVVFIDPVLAGGSGAERFWSFHGKALARQKLAEIQAAMATADLVVVLEPPLAIAAALDRLSPGWHDEFIAEIAEADRDRKALNLVLRTGHPIDDIASEMAETLLDRHGLDHETLRQTHVDLEQKVRMHIVAEFKTRTIFQESRFR